MSYAVSSVTLVRGSNRLVHDSATGAEHFHAGQRGDCCVKFTIRHTVVSSLALVAVLAVSACNAAARAETARRRDRGRRHRDELRGSPSPTPDPHGRPRRVEDDPADDATDVAVDTRVTASAEKGTLEKASLSYRARRATRQGRRHARRRHVDGRRPARARREVHPRPRGEDLRRQDDRGDPYLPHGQPDARRAGLRHGLSARRRQGGRRYAGHRALRPARRRQGELREEDDGHDDARPRPAPGTGCRRRRRTGAPRPTGRPAPR